MKIIRDYSVDVILFILTIVFFCLFIKGECKAGGFMFLFILYIPGVIFRINKLNKLHKKIVDEYENVFNDK